MHFECNNSLVKCFYFSIHLDSILIYFPYSQTLKIAFYSILMNVVFYVHQNPRGSKLTI